MFKDYHKFDMNTIEQENEYRDFLNKFQCKAVEIKADFNNLSEENKERFANEVCNIMRAYNIIMTEDNIKNILKGRYY